MPEPIVLYKKAAGDYREKIVYADVDENHYRCNFELNRISMMRKIQTISSFLHFQTTCSPMKKKHAEQSYAETFYKKNWNCDGKTSWWLFKKIFSTEHFGGSF